MVSSHSVAALVADVGPSDAGTSSMSFRRLFIAHWHMTMTYCAIYFSFGMCVALLGPTILDLGCVTSTPMRVMGWLFFIQLACSLVGTILAGYLTKWFDADHMLLVSTVLVPLSIFLLPFCKVVEALGVVLALMGINMGCIDCLANLQVIRLYGNYVAPFLQALHFSYGLGAFVSPLIAEPFLINTDCTALLGDHPHPSQSRDFNTSSTTVKPVSGYATTEHLVTLEEARALTRVEYSFFIMAALQLPVVIMAAWLVIKLRHRGWTHDHELLDESFSTDEQSAKMTSSGNFGKPRHGHGQANGHASFWMPNVSKNYVTFPASDVIGPLMSRVSGITVLTGLLLFTFDGLQNSFGGFIKDYAVKDIGHAGMVGSRGAFLNASFWGMFALGRLVSIFLATKFSAGFMLICEVVGCQLSMLLMASLQHNLSALYTATCFFGFFLSSATPTAMSLMEHFVDMTPFMTAFVVVVAALGETVFPVIVGNMLESYGAQSFVIMGNVTCLILVILFVALWFVGSRSAKFQECLPPSFIWRDGWVLERYDDVPVSRDQLMMTSQNIRCYSAHSDDNISIVTSDSHSPPSRRHSQKRDTSLR